MFPEEKKNKHSLRCKWLQYAGLRKEVGEHNNSNAQNEILKIKVCVCICVHMYNVTYFTHATSHKYISTAFDFASLFIYITEKLSNLITARLEHKGLDQNISFLIAQAMQNPVLLPCICREYLVLLNARKLCFV